MEEEVLKIVKLIEHDYDEVEAAKRVTSMVMEFIEWIGNEGIEQFSNDDNGEMYWVLYKRNTMNVDEEFSSINEMFDYWINNIRKP